MNYIKIQKMILDSVPKKDSRLVYLTFDDCYWITDNGFQLFRIPKSEMWLDVKKLTECDNLKKITNVEGEDAVLTGDEKKTHNGIAIKVASENNSVWIDKKLFDRFGIEKGLHFTLSNSKVNPLLVWEDDVLCGLIMPVRMKEDD